VVLITVCSLRGDHVDDHMPALAALAARGQRFTRAYAASNFTLAGLSGILTGRFGSTTGVLGWGRGLERDVPTLPEVLALYGYRTAAFTPDAPSGFRADYGLARGFQTFDVRRPDRDTPDGRHSPAQGGGPGATAAPLARWMAEQAAEVPLMVMLHTRTAHFPFVVEPPDEDPTGTLALLWEAGEPPDSGAMPGMAGGTARDAVVPVATDPLQEHVQRVGAPALAAWRAAYAAAVTRADADIAAVLEAAERRGRPTVVAVVADHGESLGDHGELLHGAGYYEGVVRVPLVLSVPGLPAGEHDALVSHVDLLPTLLELVGAVAPAGLDGASLIPLLEDRQGAVRSMARVEGGVAHRPDAPLNGALIAPPWTLLLQDRGCGGGPPRLADGSPRPCLFDLDADPDQRSEVSGDHPAVVAELRALWTAPAAEGAAVWTTPGFIEALRRDGYDFRPPSAATQVPSDQGAGDQGREHPERDQ